MYQVNFLFCINKGDINRQVWSMSIPFDFSRHSA